MKVPIFKLMPYSCSFANTVLVIIYWNFTVFQYRSDLPQVKRNLISGIANLVNEFPHELPNDLRLTILGNIRTISNYGGDFFPSRKQTLVIAVKKKTKVDIKLFLSYLVLLDFSIFFQNILSGIVVNHVEYSQKLWISPLLLHL